jgi:hypothetical protein
MRRESMRYLSEKFYDHWDRVVILTFLVLTFVFAFALQARAGDYVYRNGDTSTVYYRWRVSVPYYYCGKPYYRYEYRYRKVLNYNDKDWRQQALSLIDKQKERESYNQTLGYLGAQGLMAPASSPFYSTHQQQATIYPSATGSTLGAFSSYEYSRYGSTNPQDVNRGQEIIGGLIDQYNRASADNARRGDEAHLKTTDLIESQGHRIAAVAELQETRAAVKEMSQGMKSMFMGFSEAVRQMKPEESEHVRFESGQARGSYKGPPSQRHQPTPAYYPQQQPPPQPQYPNEDFVPEPPQNGSQGPGGMDIGSLNARYCANCHGEGLDSPSAGFAFDFNRGIDEREYGALGLRLNPNAPVWVQGSASKRPYRMPPEGSPQPSLEERRFMVDVASSLVGQ